MTDQESGAPAVLPQSSKDYKVRRIVDSLASQTRSRFVAHFRDSDVWAPTMPTDWPTVHALARRGLIERRTTNDKRLAQLTRNQTRRKTEGRDGLAATGHRMIERERARLVELPSRRTSVAHDGRTGGVFGLVGEQCLDCDVGVEQHGLWRLPGGIVEGEHAAWKGRPPACSTRLLSRVRARCRSGRLS